MINLSLDWASTQDFFGCRPARLGGELPLLLVNIVAVGHGLDPS